jgi:hypothetical protein
LSWLRVPAISADRAPDGARIWVTILFETQPGSAGIPHLKECQPVGGRREVPIQATRQVSRTPGFDAGQDAALHVAVVNTMRRPLSSCTSVQRGPLATR